MRQENLSQARQLKKEGVTKSTFKGKRKYLVRIKIRNNISTVASFRKESEANDCYRDLIDGKITIEDLLKK